MRRSIAGILLASSLVVPATAQVVVAPNASATPCDHQHTTTKVYRNGTRIWQRINGSDSDYNRTKDPITRTLTFGKSESSSVRKHWEIGGSVSGGWGPVKVEISGKYGEDYVEAAETSASKSRTMSIRPGYTGWVRVIVYQRFVMWEQRVERWSSAQQACVMVLTDRARWAAPKVQYVSITKKGHRYPE